MFIERVHTAGRISQVVDSGRTVYLASQISTGAPGQSVAKQTEDILNRINIYLAEAGTNKSKLLTATIWVTDMAKFAEMNAVWHAWQRPMPSMGRSQAS